jgi:hypothetical protein
MQEMRDDLDNEQIGRMFQHAMYAQSRFDGHLNFFLIFESVLLGVVGMLSSKSASTNLLLLIIICLGFLLTVLWGYTQAREKFLFEIAQKRLLEGDPVYRETFQRRLQTKWPARDTPLLAYLVPGLVATVWIVMFLLMV